MWSRIVGRIGVVSCRIVSYRIVSCGVVSCRIGVAGGDPATDLRGVGVLSLLQLLYLVTEPKSQQLARATYLLSLHHTQACQTHPPTHLQPPCLLLHIYI